jgi:NADPH2:quinone reductase
MRAWQVQGQGRPTEVLHLVDIDEPQPGPGELRLRVRTVAVGLPDVFMCSGTYPLTPSGGAFVPGQEVCGIVDAVGDGVDVPIGTRLMAVTSFYDGRGGFADVTVARAASAYRVPETMSDVDAASFRIGFSTAWIGLVRRGALQAGEQLLALGAAGGSGATAVQLGKALGARVLAVASGPEKLDFCRRMGADVLIDRTTQDLRDAVLAATDGRGVDVVYDPVGGALADASVRAMAPFARLLAVGFASGTWAQPPTHQLVRANASLVGVYPSGLTRADQEADHEALLALHAQGKLESFATVRSFAGLPDAVDAVATGGVIGKMVIDVAGS